MPGPEGLAADSGRLRQLLHNLIRNAGETRPEGGTTLLVRSRLLDKNGKSWLELELRDNGPGFPAMVLDQPFEPYVTNKSNGSGLGLAICRKIVSEHDGKITLDNHPDGGARVQVRLPLA